STSAADSFVPLMTLPAIQTSRGDSAWITESSSFALRWTTRQDPVAAVDPCRVGRAEPPAAPRPRLAAAPTRTDKPVIVMNTMSGRRMTLLSNPFLRGGEVGLDCERMGDGFVECQAAAGRPGGGEFPRA